jgi:hypothetical protein
MRKEGSKVVLSFILKVVMVAFLTAGCSLLEGPPTLVIPTPPAPPPPTVAVVPLATPAAGELVTDPVSDVVPTVDPIVDQLIQAVSQQQLMAYVRTLGNFGSRNAFSDTTSETFGIGAARRWIFNEFTRVGNGRLQVAFQEFPLVYAGHSADQANVVATLPGKAANNNIIVIMAHYDTRGPDVTDGLMHTPAANDNASGVALLLESARVLSSQEWNQTIVFLALSAEEEGTFGSRYFAQNAFLDNMNILAAINYDSVGGRAGIPQTVRVFSPGFLDSPSGALARYYEYVSGLYIPTFPVLIYDALDREGRYGDQREFLDLGMPAIRVIESQEDPDLLNSPRDTWDRIDYNYLQKITQLNVAVVANLAGGPVPPTPPIVANMAEPGSYLLTWPVGTDAAGYAISFRPLDSPFYPPFRFVQASKAGNVVLTGLDPNVTYAVSLAALSQSGMVSSFSAEAFVSQTATNSTTTGEENIANTGN